MAKEILLYSGIYSYTAEAFINALEEFKAEDLVIRQNTPGGSVNYGWGMIAKMQEHEGKITIKIDGASQSMGLYMLPFADYVEATDVATGLLHRADGYVSSPEDQKYLDDRNKDLRAKFAAKINEAKLKELKGISLDDVFASDKRIDVSLTAKEMKAIGLVDKIVKLTPKEIEAIDNRMFDIAAKKTEESKPKPEILTQKNKVMTLAEIKANHPALYAEIIALGVADERDRVGAWMAFADIDPVAVKAGIDSGKDLTRKETAEFTRKGMSAEGLTALSKESAKEVKTPEQEIAAKTADEKKKADFEKEVRAELGLK